MRNLAKCRVWQEEAPCRELIVHDEEALVLQEAVERVDKVATHLHHERDLLPGIFDLCVNGTSSFISQRAMRCASKTTMYFPSSPAEASGPSPVFRPLDPIG